MAKKLPSASKITFTGADGVEYELTPKEELFCKYFSTDRDCFGNGTQAYINAYGSKTTYGAARVEAHRMLTKPNVMARCRVLIDIFFSDEIADKELAMVALQYADLSSKVAAIREYNKVKGRITEKLRWVDENDDLTDDELDQQIADQEKSSNTKEKPKGKKKE